MLIVKISEGKKLKELYNEDSLCQEGLTEEGIPAWLDAIRKYVPVTNERVYIFDGKLMNEVYGLTGDNAYKPDLSFAAIKLCDLDLSNKERTMMFFFGHMALGRWFYDVVDNNARRERQKGNM